MDDALVYEEDGLPTKGDASGSHSKKNRIFDDKMRNQCWQKADVVPGRHPERWRKDVAGNIVCRRLTRCEGCLCYEYDHIRPFSKGLCCPCLRLTCCNRLQFVVMAKLGVIMVNFLNARVLKTFSSLWMCVGGKTEVSNCQILQSRVNRLKSNRSDLASVDLKQFSCDLKFTGEFD
jgi:hypothetical protein